MLDLLHPITAHGGHVVEVRFLRPDDGDLLVDLVRQLSPDSRYSRFRVPMEVIDPEEIRLRLPAYLDVDGIDHVALLATVQESGVERAIAVARFRRKPGSTQAEAAVVVRDDWQGYGVGVGLMMQMVDVARSLGIESLLAWVQSTNRSAQRMVKALPFPTKHTLEHGEDYIVMDIRNAGQALQRQDALHEQSVKTGRASEQN